MKLNALRDQVKTKIFRSSRVTRFSNLIFIKTVGGQVRVRKPSTFSSLVKGVNKKLVYFLRLRALSYTTKRGVLLKSLSTNFVPSSSYYTSYIKSLFLNFIVRTLLTSESTSKILPLFRGLPTTYKDLLKKTFSLVNNKMWVLNNNVSPIIPVRNSTILPILQVKYLTK